MIWFDSSRKRIPEGDNWSSCSIKLINVRFNSALPEAVDGDVTMRLTK